MTNNTNSVIIAAQFVADFVNKNKNTLSTKGMAIADIRRAYEAVAPLRLNQVNDASLSIMLHLSGCVKINEGKPITTRYYFDPSLTVVL